MKRVTIKDVAKDAGFSISIASFALNNVKGRVSKEVQVKVIESANKLGYVPNTFAKNLKGSNSNTYALVFNDNILQDRNSSGFQFIASLIKYAKHMDKDILMKMQGFEENQEKAIREYIELNMSRKVEGFIFYWIDMESSCVEELNARGVNYVVIADDGRVEGGNSVYIDNFKAIREGVRYIYETGYEEIYYLGMKSQGQTGREQGYISMMKELKLKGYPVYYESKFRGKGEIWKAVKSVIQARENKLAIVCWNDIDAINLLDILHSQGIKIPEEVGVMGFDDISDTENTHPPLTTIRQPFELMAHKSIDILIQNSGAGNISSIVQVEFNCNIIKRQSI